MARCEQYDAQIVEIVQHIALNILTNTNNAAQTAVVFPEVKPGNLEPEPCATGSGAGSH